MKRTILNYFSSTNLKCQNKRNQNSTSSCFINSPPKTTEDRAVVTINSDEIITISSEDETLEVVEPALKKRKYLSRQKPSSKENGGKFYNTKKEINDNEHESGSLGGALPSKKSDLTKEAPGNTDCNKAEDKSKTPAIFKDALINVFQNPKQIDKTDVEKRPYYLENFKLAISTVMNDKADANLFEGEDANWIEKFGSLPSLAQQLYVRLFHRKMAWLPLNKISYKEIGECVTKCLQTLTDQNFLECSMCNGETNLKLAELLHLLSAPAVKSLAKPLHISVIGQKEKISLAIQNLCKKQRSVLSSKNSTLEQTVTKRALKSLGPCYKVASIPKQAFNRLLLVFDVTKGTEDDSEYSIAGRSNSNQMGYYGRNQQLASILMAGMGKVIFPSYTIKKTTPIFRSRSELLEYEAAYHLLSEMYAAAENNQWELALEICEIASEKEKSICENTRQRAVTLPHFIRSFSAPAVYTRIKSLQVEVLQRLKDYTRAAEILQNLLNQESFCVSRRGYWAERLALNLDQHLHKPQAALDVIEKALMDEYVRVGHVASLVERAEKIISSKKVETLSIETILKQRVFIKAKEVTIVGRLLPKRMQTGKARFMKIDPESVDGDDVLLCSVEELALDHYKCEGFDEGLHAEGSTFTCFFALLMWDIIFMPGVDDVFRTPYQTHPLDYTTDEFYQNRKNVINQRIKDISEWENDRFSAPKIITDHWNACKDVTCVGMNWERFSSLLQLLTLAECIGGKVMSGIMEIFAKDPRHTRSGLPDLVVWNASSKAYKLVEVKGPGDRLFGNQKVWMHHLVSLGANVEVCHVTANASRKLSK